MNLSSSTTFAANNVLRHAINRPNIGVQKKHNSAHQVMAEATMEESKKLVTALKEISDTNKEVERKTIDLQIETHSTNLDYKRERFMASVENTRISLLYQLAVVQAISSLAKALACLNQPQVVENPPRCVPILTTSDQTSITLGDLQQEGKLACAWSE
jgi:hypothetical protein